MEPARDAGGPGIVRTVGGRYLEQALVFILRHQDHVRVRTVGRVNRISVLHGRMKVSHGEFGIASCWSFNVHSSPCQHDNGESAPNGTWWRQEAGDASRGPGDHRRPLATGEEFAYLPAYKTAKIRTTYGSRCQIRRFHRA